MFKRGWITPILVAIICTVLLLSYQSKQLGQSLASHSNLPQIPWEKELADIKELHIVSGTQTIKIIRQGSSWKMTSPVTSDVDATYLYDALSFVLKPPILSTVASPATDLKSFGIDTYSKSVSLIDQEGKKYELICGSEADSSSYYTFEPLSHTIYTIDKNAFDKMSTVISDWRDTRYIHFNPDTTATITVKVGTTQHTIRKFILNNAPAFTSTTLSDDATAQVISFLKTTRVEKFIADAASPEIIASYGFDTPLVSITLTSDTGLQQTFDITESSSHSKSFYVLDRKTKNIYTIPYFQLQLLQSTYDNQ